MAGVELPTGVLHTSSVTEMIRPFAASRPPSRGILMARPSKGCADQPRPDHAFERRRYHRNAYRPSRTPDKSPSSRAKSNRVIIYPKAYFHKIGRILLTGNNNEALPVLRIYQKNSGQCIWVEGFRVGNLFPVGILKRLQIFISQQIYGNPGGIY